MSHRPTKEELDAQFEQFLKESVSDDSQDLGQTTSPDKQSPARSGQKSSQKATVSWWQDDDHSSGGAGGAESPKRRFIKTKTSQPEINNVVSRDPIHKPVPKPRLKAPDKPVQSDKTPKAPALDVSQTGRRKASSDDSDSDSLRGPAPDRSPEPPPASTDGDSDDGSGKSFRKSPSTSQPIEEEDEDPGDAGLSEEGRGDDPLSRASTETRAVNMSSVGLDTQEEEDEKARFFAQLEAGTPATIDYSKLNRELDSNSSTIDTDLRQKERAAPEQRDESGGRASEAVGESPDSPHYSEDFTDEENMKEPLEQKPKKSPILAGVSLYDSLDETGGEDGKDTAGSLDRGDGHKGQAYGQSGGSDMEALQEAYRQIQTVQSSDDRYFSAEGRRKLSRPSSPSSPPHPASTTESDLPTAEELMRPIRPDDHHMRGFTLQPASSVELNQGETSRPLEKTFPVVSRTESDRKQPGKAGAAAGVKGASGVTGQPTSSPDPTWSIREEVDRLMRDQNSYPTQTASQATTARKQPGSRGSSVAPMRGRTAQNPRSSGTSRNVPTGKAPSSLPRSLHHPLKTKSTKSQRDDDVGPAESGLKVSGELVASVQSLVSVLQQQMLPGGRHDAVQEVRGPHESRPMQHPPPISKDDDRSEVEDLRVQLAQKDRELQLMKEAAAELSSLRQQNFLLQSKLRSAEEAGEKKKWMEAADASTEEKLKHIDKEIKEQETLIKGYQQENEKLYLQMKAQQARGKANEEAMFTENQRLLNELAVTREQQKKTCNPVSSLSSAHHSQRISELLAQIGVLQRNEAQRSEDNLRLKQEKQSLEVDLQLMKKERDLAKAHVISTSGDKSFEMRVLEDKQREEVLALKKKLQWFAENQELLDRDAGRLKTATAEIQQLKEQVEKLKQEVARRGSEQQRKARDKSVDTKRMQDLERQVKELEQILRSRNPNSLPALIYAAAMAENGAGTSPPGRINALLERRIQRLEAELESHDEDAKRSLRTMEQQFHRIKLRYEQQISDLEQQLQQKPQAEAAAGSEPSPGPTLEEELGRAREHHQRKESGLREQVQSLQQQLRNKAQPSPGRHQRQAEAAFGARMERLNQELASKTRSIRELSRTVERLQRERRTVLSGPPAPRPHPGPTRTQGAAAGGGAPPEETYPAAPNEKTYQPTVFSGSHISEVLQENEVLKQRVELLRLQGDEEKEALKAGAVRAEEELSRLKERFAEQLSSMKAEHLGVLERLRAAHALQHSSSAVAELSNQLSSKEVAMKHLQEQLKEQQGTKEALRVSRSREDALQKQLTRLLQELREAKEAQSSEVKLLCSLEKKILNMELRQQHREEELQQVIGGVLQVPEADLQSEVQRWRRVAQEKSRELEAFRSELDAILDILRHLQRHGLAPPPPRPRQPGHGPPPPEQLIQSASCLPEKTPLLFI